MTVTKDATKFTTNSRGLVISIPRASFVNVVNFLIPLLIWIVISFSPCRMDSTGYQAIFYNNTGKNYLHVEAGFYYICKLAYAAGMKYWSFRSLLIGIAIIIFSVALSRMHVHKTAFWIYYLFYPMLYNFVQIRFFFAISFALLAVSFLINMREDNKRRSVTWFVIWVIIGTLFHSAVIITFIYLVPAFLTKRKMYWFIAAGMVVELFLLFFVNRVGAIIQNAISAFRSLVTYYNVRINPVDGIQFIGTYIVFLLIYLYAIKSNEQISQYEYELGVAEEDKYQSIVEKNIAITNILLVWLSFLNSTFSRYFQLSILLITTFMLSKKLRNTKNVFFLRIGTLGILIFLGYFFLRGRIWNAWSESFLQVHSFSELSQMY